MCAQKLSQVATGNNFSRLANFDDHAIETVPIQEPPLLERSHASSV